MKKKQKYIRTSQIEKWQKLDRYAKLLPLLLTLALFGGASPFLLKSIIIDKVTFEQIVPMLLGLAVMSFFGSVTSVIVYRSVSKTSKKTAIKNATFSVTEDFDYYREKLSGLSPATISILMDLEVEPEKDIAASILRLTLIGVLSPDGRVINPDKPGIKDSDKVLIKTVEKGAMTVEERLFWRRKAEDESAAGGYVEKLPWDTKKEAPRKGCTVAPIKFLVITAVYIAILFIFDLNEGLDFLSRILESIPDDFGAVPDTSYMAEPRFAELLLKGLVALFGCFIWLSWPILTVVRLTAVEYGTKLFKRTPQGEIAAEKIAGMQNFLHDFSNLSEAHKQQLVLWDDFLIYAVVLEENRRIVDEILSRKGLTYQAISFI